MKREELLRLQWDAGKMVDSPYRNVILVLTGYACAGKDTAGQYLIRTYGFKRFAFADKLKLAAQALSISQETVIDGVRTVQELPYWDGRAETKRKPCVQLGKTMRDIVHPTIWVDALVKDSQFLTAIQEHGVVITDCRYSNEWEALQALAAASGASIQLLWIDRDVLPQGEEAVATAPLRERAMICVNDYKMQLYRYLDYALAVTVNGKHCNQCGAFLPLEAFPENKKFLGNQGIACTACSKAMRQKQYQKHKEKVKASARKRYHANAEELRPRLYATTKAWLARNPEKRAEYDERRRARRVQAGGKFTGAEWQLLKELFGFSCLQCGQAEPDIKLVVDHVIPLSKGGRNDLSNLQPLCRSCNARKFTTTVDYRQSFLGRQFDSLVASITKYATVPLDTIRELLQLEYI